MSNKILLPLFFTVMTTTAAEVTQKTFGTCNRQTVEYSKLRTCAPIC